MLKVDPPAEITLNLLELRSFFGSVNKCDQMGRLFFNIWPFPTMKICPAVLQIAKVGTKVCQILNKPYL